MQGIFVAFFILSCWIVTLFWALTQVQLLGPSDILKSAGLILMIQFLYVGLFITVHDACHGSVAPGKPVINLWVGRIFAFLYAGIIFDRLAKKHHQHHQFSGTFTDPDFHAEGKNSFFLWLCRFLNQYVTVRQILIMCAVAQVLFHVFHLPEINVLTFWVVPSILSSLQLFYFGTYLPHRKIKNQDFIDHHKARNFSMPLILSWASCYHFGAFHHIHHTSPGIPWYKLPDCVPDHNVPDQSPSI